MADIIGGLRKIAPWIGAAASVALPGPLGAAAGALGKVLGSPDKPATVEATTEGIETAVQAIIGDPDKMAKLRQVDNDFKLAWQAAGFKRETDILALEVEDRKDARNRQIQLRDKTPQIGFYLLLTLLAVTIAALIKYQVPDGNKAIVFGLVGSVSTLVIMAATYFYGSTQQGARKTELLAQAPALGSVIPDEKGN